MVGRFQVEIRETSFLVFLLILLVNCTSSPTESIIYNTSNLKSGDIILRKSYGLISEIVVTNLDDTLDISHCGIIQKEQNGNFNIIHCLSKKVSNFDGVQICPLQDFLNDSRAETVRVVRFRLDTSSVLISKALFHLQHRTPFDEQFDAMDSSAFFCSEFPIHIIKSGFGIDISKHSTKPGFSIFFNNNYFDEIDFVQFTNDKTTF